MWRNNKYREKSERRNKFEIWSEILESCLKTPQTQSWLRRNLNLKTNAFKEAITFLINRNLIEKEENFEKVVYLATKRGEEALNQYYLLITNFFNKQEKI
ncbi:MAG: winged helix-turn-helix domain-containing protein [Candidatus Hodarchaeales archaeon]